MNESFHSSTAQEESGGDVDSSSSYQKQPSDRASAPRRKETRTLLNRMLPKHFSLDYEPANDIDDEDMSTSSEDQVSEQRYGGQRRLQTSLWFALFLLGVIVFVTILTRPVIARIRPEPSVINTTTTTASQPVCGGPIMTLKSESVLEDLPHGAVAADHPLCSQMGLDILRRNGNAVDAAVAVALCLGVANPASSGLGGGAFMLVHAEPSVRETDLPAFDDARSPTTWHPSKTGKITEVVDCREVAPAAATTDMYHGLPPLASVRGGLGMCCVCVVGLGVREEWYQ